MAFVQENGSGLLDSNSFVSVAFFKSYHGDRGREYVDPDTGFNFSDLKIQQALVVASDFISSKFRFVGIRQNIAQAMEWPRVDAFYSDDGRTASGVPKEVQEAVAELAWRQLSGHIAPDPEISDSFAQVTRKKERVGPIEEDTSYGGDGSVGMDFKPYPFAEKRMKFLIITGHRLLRA